MRLARRGIVFLFKALIVFYILDLVRCIIGNRALDVPTVLALTLQ